MKHKTIKFLEENKRGQLWVPGLGEEFLEMITKNMIAKEKNGK